MWSVAADSGELAAALIPAVWTFLGVVVVTLGTIAVQALKSRSDRRTTTASPAAIEGTALIQIARDQGVHAQRLDDSDERDDMQDHRLDALERWAVDHDPEWRSR